MLMSNAMVVEMKGALWIEGIGTGHSTTRHASAANEAEGHFTEPRMTQPYTLRAMLP